MQYLFVKRVGNKVDAWVCQELTDALRAIDTTYFRQKTVQTEANPDAYGKKAVMSGVPEFVMEVHGKGLVRAKDIFVLRYPKSIRRSVFFTLKDGTLRLTRFGKPLPTTKPARFPLSFDLRKAGADKTIKIFGYSR